MGKKKSIFPQQMYTNSCSFGVWESNERKGKQDPTNQGRVTRIQMTPYSTDLRKTQGKPIQTGVTCLGLQSTSGRVFPHKALT